MSSLYDLTQEYISTKQSLNDLFDNDEIDAETLKDTIESLLGEPEAKISNIGRYVASELNDIKGLDIVIKNAQERKKRALKAIDYLKSHTVELMSHLDINKVVADDIVVSTRKSSRVVIDDEDRAIQEYGTEVITYKYSKSDVKADIANCDFAHIETNYNLVIK